MLTPLDMAIIAASDTDITQAALGAKFGVTHATVSRHAAKLRDLGHAVAIGGQRKHPVTQGGHDAELLQWEALGLSCREMAERTGTTTATVSTRLVRLRLLSGQQLRKVHHKNILRQASGRAPEGLLTPMQQTVWDAARSAVSYKVAAAQIGISTGTFGTHLHFARRRIAEAST